MTAGAGQSNGGVWLTPDQRVVKRLLPGVEDQRHHAYWRRQAEVAASGIVATTPGVRSPGCVRVDRDADGITLWMTEVEAVTHEPLELARALGRFGSARIAEPEWGTRGILRDRLASVARRGGWVGIEAADLEASLWRDVQALWVRRDAALAELDQLPRVPNHGDAHPANLLGREGADVVAIDWEQFGIGPVGFDIGYLLLAVDVPFDDLLTAYQDGAPDQTLVRRGAVLTAAYTAISRAAWALSQPGPGDHLDRLNRLADIVAEACGTS